ncbi:mitochondrial 37S ribosomal protein bS21m MRP21 PWA37_001743 [Arxiozyma heterogenica]|uniref:Ribosomal protein S21 n=1 Tax=Arxiozyma heterogenica TaxID=278026 RepID=A0AAN7WGZ6_9SACH|nr:hypothetical protein RI543_002427 [Kazachstania heterogenica]
MWKQNTSLIIRSGVTFQNSGKILLGRQFSQLTTPLLQKGQRQDNNGNINIPGFSNNPLRDFTLHDSTTGLNKPSSLSGLKIDLDTLTNTSGAINNHNNNNNNNPFSMADNANNEIEIKKKLEKALLLENSDIRETALSTKFGPLAGRTVDVINSDTATAFRRLASILSSNQVWKDRRDQRFYMKPGKKKELKRSQHHRRRFMKGFKRLMDIVKDANRKGY